LDRRCWAFYIGFEATHRILLTQGLEYLTMSRARCLLPTQTEKGLCQIPSSSQFAGSSTLTTAVKCAVTLWGCFMYMGWVWHCCALPLVRSTLTQLLASWSWGFTPGVNTFKLGIPSRQEISCVPIWIRGTAQDTLGTKALCA
jgi:hypothetical protein